MIVATQVCSYADVYAVDKPSDEKPSEEADDA